MSFGAQGQFGGCSSSSCPLLLNVCSVRQERASSTTVQGSDWRCKDVYTMFGLTLQQFKEMNPFREMNPVRPATCCVVCASLEHVDLFFFLCPLSLSHPLTLTHSLPLSPSPSLTPSPSLSLSLSLAPSPSHPLPLSRTLSLSLSPSPSLSHPLPLSLTLSLSLSPSLNLSQPPSPSLSPSPSLTPSPTPSCTPSILHSPKTFSLPLLQDIDCSKLLPQGREQLVHEILPACSAFYYVPLVSWTR
ncbi:unnamed protein product [Closterium sp. Naga37s-1]|nr:unnamed protein product [Closterium sp. Naga37s-1]